MAMQRTEPSCHAKGVSSTRRRDLPAYFCIAICISMSHVVASAASTCPRKCECIWRDAKITVDCSNQGLGSVPTDVDVSSQVLNVSGNHIPLFNGRQFSRFGLTNLQRISASNCGLGQIDGHAFQGLTNLVELNLDNNNLAEVPHEALAGDVPSLMTLNLRHNSISRIPSRAFHQLTYLQKLDLSENKIQVVESGAFEGLRSLQRIYLHANRISNLDARDIPPSLHGITLHDNRWSCDCHQRSFRLWLAQSNVPRPVEPVCHGPRRLLGIRIHSLVLAEFACAPQLSPTSMYLTVPKGKNVSIVCRVASDPLSDIIWYFNGNQIEDAAILFKQDNYAWSHHASASIQPGELSEVEHGRGRSQSPVNRIYRHDIISDSETRSELLIHNTSVYDNGTYRCEAKNKAALSVSNFTLHVTDHIDTPKILQLRLEYFVAVAVGVILILVLIIMAVAVLLIRLCRRRIKSKQSEMMKADERNGSSSTLYGAKKVGPMPAKMPKHIRMGTGGFRNPQPTTSISASSQQSLNPYLNTTISDRPDLLTDHSLSSTGKGSKVASTGTMSSESSRVSSSGSQPNSQQGSYRMAMENIIDDYRLSNPQELRTKPLIGSTSLNDQGTTMSRVPAPRPLSSVMSDCLRGSTGPFPDSCISRSGRDLLGIDPRIVETVGEGRNGRYPVDYGLPRSPPVDPSNLRAFANPNYRHLPHSNTLPHHYHSYQGDPQLTMGQPSFSLGHHPMGTLPSHYFRPPGGTTTLDALALWQYQQLQNQISHQPQSLHPAFLRTKQVLPDEKYPDEDSRHAIMSDHHLYQSLPVRSFMEGSHPTPLSPILSQASHPPHLQLSEPLYTSLQNTSSANHLPSDEKQNKPPQVYPSDRQMDMSHYESIGRGSTNGSMNTMIHLQQQQQQLLPTKSSILAKKAPTTSSSRPTNDEHTGTPPPPPPPPPPSDTIPSESIKNSVFSSLPTIKSLEDHTISTYLAPLAEQEDGGTTSGAGSSSWTSETPSTVPLVEDFSPSEETKTDEVDEQKKGEPMSQTRNPLGKDNDQSTSNLHFEVQQTSCPRSMENDASHPGKTDVKASSEFQHEKKPETTSKPLSPLQLVTIGPNEKPKNDDHNLLSNDTREQTDQQNQNGLASQGENLGSLSKDKNEPTFAAFKSVQSSFASEIGGDDDVGSDSSLQLISTSQEDDEEGREPSAKSDSKKLENKPDESSDESVAGVDTLKIYQELDDAFISLDQEVNNFEAGVNDSN